ncbi:Type II secretory pathway ATPase GspE/PulE or T4P pilus assembly pathway ATPase PilB [Paraburkholderia fungorum]|uniref:Type II secretory pathway ATPase GspE/PulE or T4P pilus assembly pathway ATPase PilB n=1 Tax=Paraburkholderia fungorum TaxID=134537 RepID=A0A1H1JXK7_9BURK|nr:ATPase, T2SS/T4P/T4SS family [Paraburkholderia fungorum]SDR54357.1 Type II secretory pathway ATPase GspE/PulE or T4P pilus assembly pathway ATPase PilB [Paraburkholderia fungorum]
MSMFSGVESDEPAARGFFGRLKGWRPGFTESGASTILPVSEPRFDTDSLPSGAQPMTLGMRLRNADITDVEPHDPYHPHDPHDPHGPSDERVPPRTREGHTPAEKDPAREPECAQAGEPVDRAEHPPQHAQRDTRQDAAEPPVDPTIADEGSWDTDAVIAKEPPAPPLRTQEPVTAESEKALIESDVLYTPIGLPQLISVDGLGPFKRILCGTAADATLNITAAARRSFVAVDMQAGVAMVVATREFHEGALYATYLKDLERADIAIREEMVATQDVIAAIYAAAKAREAGSVVPDGSRAIGTFRDVLEAAHEFNSSDAHWEYRDFNDDVEVRFRVDGDLYTYRRMPKALVKRALSAAYQDLVQRNTNSGETFQPSAPQSAMIPMVSRMDLLNLRWQSAPAVGGFDVALRLLDGNFRNVRVMQPAEMGLEPSQLAILDLLSNVSGGVTILSGETGSAKSTLLRAMSYNMAARDLRKQYAVSEPAEYPNPWLSEISIARRTDETDDEASRKSAEVVRTLMRMDPDDLTVNEIRDRIMAALVAELALTGHPVRTTIHGDSLIGVFMRLAGGRLQLPMDEVSSEKFVNAAGNQKLIPLLCPHCKVPARDVMPASQLELLSTKFGLDTARMACRSEDGCERCRLKGLFTRAGKVAGGTKGQTLAMELYQPTPEFLAHVAVRDWSGAEKVWRGERVSGFGDADMTGKTIYEHALYKASTGIIDPRFIDLTMRPFAHYRVMPDRDGRMPS